MIRHSDKAVTSSECKCLWGLNYPNVNTCIECDLDMFWAHLRYQTTWTGQVTDGSVKPF